MKRLRGWLLRWGLGKVEARVLLSELEEAHREKVTAGGRTPADRWMRREIWRVALRAAGMRLGGHPRRHRAEGTPLRSNTSFGTVVGSVFKDIRFGGRVLIKRPFFATMVVGTLGLGIGASTVVFSLVDGVLIKDLPFQRSGELINVWKTYPHWRGEEIVGEAWDKIGLVWNEYLALQENSEVIRELGIHKAREMALTGSGDPLRLRAGEANAALFPLLGVRLTMGRGFAPGEEGPGAPRVAVLSHSFWRSRFGSDPGIVGRTIELDEESFEIIGVLERDVRMPSTVQQLLDSSLDGGDRALWVPIRFDLVPRDGFHGSQDLEAVVRLIPGATLDQLRAELESVVRGGRSESDLGFRLTPRKEEIVGGARSSLRLLMAAAGFLLLIACVNAAALLLSEGVGRRREIATRLALGAGRGRIGRQLLTESVILGLLGGAVGLALAVGGIRVFLALAPSLPRLDEVGVNPRVFLFSVLAGIGTGVLFGLVPALSLRKSSIRSVQTSGGRGAARGWTPFQRVLLATELAMTVVLLVSSGLLVRSLLKMSAVDPGFDGTSVATVRAHFSESEMHDEAGRLTARILERVRTIPEVEFAGAADGLPFPGRITGTPIRIERGTEQEEFISRDHVVTPGYLEALGMRVVMGRSFLETDIQAGAPLVMVINDLMARRYWPGSSPIGETVQRNMLDYEVVGVVNDVRERHLTEAPKPMVYVVGPEPPGEVSIVARARGDAAALSAELRRAVWSVAPTASLTQETTVPALVRDSTSAERYRTALVLTFGILAALLASIGVFGVTSHGVSKRWREMGIRMAMGAEGDVLVRAVVSETLIPGVVGIGVGVLLALFGARLMGSYIFGIEPWDLPTYGSVVLGLTALSVLAAAIPAARVGRVDPVRVLREE